MKRTAILICLISGFLLSGSAFAGPALADDVAGVAALRDKATKAWYAKDFAGGVKALKEAIALYEGVDPLPVEQWAMTMRMLTWHQMKAGDAKGVRETFHSLVDTLAQKPGLSGFPNEAIVSWQALRTVADSFKDYDKSIAVYEDAAVAFEAAKDRKLTAQVLHDAGNFSGLREQHERADAFLTKAAAGRARIKDHLGYAWSANQLAYWRMQASQFNEARAPIREAYQTMIQHRLIEPQAAIEANLRRMLDELAQRPEHNDTSVREWLTELATNDSNFPRVIPRTYLIRAMLDWSQQGKDPLSGARLVLKELDDLAPEERADVTLQCASAALRSKDAKRTRKWLAAIKIPKDRPDWNHIIARKHGVAALAAKKAETMEAEATAALDLFEKLGDVGGTRSVAAQLRENAPHALGEALTTRINRILQSGSPGGAGGSASGGGVGDVSKMAWHDPLFSVAVIGNKVTVHDLAGGRERAIDVSWKPRNIGFNGLSLTVFGRYMVVQSLNYGGGASASGSSGTITMDKLGAYRPLREGHVLHILRNGAVRYARVPADNEDK